MSGITSVLRSTSEKPELLEISLRYGLIGDQLHYYDDNWSSAHKFDGIIYFPNSLPQLKERAMGFEPTTSSLGS